MPCCGSESPTPRSFKLSATSSSSSSCACGSIHLQIPVLKSSIHDGKAVQAGLLASSIAYLGSQVCGEGHDFWVAYFRIRNAWVPQRQDCRIVAVVVPVSSVHFWLAWRALLHLQDLAAIFLGRYLLTAGPTKAVLFVTGQLSCHESLTCPRILNARKRASKSIRSPAQSHLSCLSSAVEPMCRAL